MENRLSDFINTLALEKGITKTEISKELGFKCPTSFYTSIKNGGLTWKKILVVLDKYGYDINFKKK